MATRTGIYNKSGNFIMLPPPYMGGLNAGQQAVVSDTPAVVLAALGGAAFVGINLQVNTLPATTPLTVHAAGVGGPRVLEAFGTNGAAGVTFPAAKVGDVLLSASISGTGGGTAGDLTASFESTVSVAGQLQQTSALNLSTVNVLLILSARS